MCGRSWKCVVDAGNVWYRLEMCGRGWKCVCKKLAWCERGSQCVSRKLEMGVKEAPNMCVLRLEMCLE
jgi:hypothetical protein